ncbi:MAG: helix-turn-helix transcriptional regulator, partial [Endozoicomonas sp.]
SADLGVQRTIRVPGEHLRAIDFKHWDQLHKAINSKKWIHISYISLSNTASSRIIFPLGLFYWGAKWTLGCWCSLKEEYRDFRVDRIESIDSAIPSTDIPTTVNLLDYIEFQKNRSLQYTTDTTVSGA